MCLLLDSHTYWLAVMQISDARCTCTSMYTAVLAHAYAMQLIRALFTADVYTLSVGYTVLGSVEARNHISCLLSCACFQDLFAASLETPQSSNPRRGRKWYFERLEVQTIKCNVTLIPRPGSRDVESGLSPGRIRMAATLGVNFIDINNVPLKINALAFQNALLSPSILMSHITRHLINSVSIV